MFTTAYGQYWARRAPKEWWEWTGFSDTFSDTASTLVGRTTTGGTYGAYSVFAFSGPVASTDAYSVSGGSLSTALLSPETFPNNDFPFGNVTMNGTLTTPFTGAKGIFAEFEITRNGIDFIDFNWYISDPGFDTSFDINFQSSGPGFAVYEGQGSYTETSVSYPSVISLFPAGVPVVVRVEWIAGSLMRLYIGGALQTPSSNFNNMTGAANLLPITIFGGNMRGYSAGGPPMPASPSLTLSYITFGPLQAFT